MLAWLNWLTLHCLKWEEPGTTTRHIQHCQRHWDSQDEISHWLSCWLSSVPIPVNRVILLPGPHWLKRAGRAESNKKPSNGCKKRKRYWLLQERKKACGKNLSVYFRDWVTTGLVDWKQPSLTDFGRSANLAWSYSLPSLPNPSWTPIKT